MTQAFVFRIFIAAILGGAIGLEREYRAKEAGFRTHFLVALGSALFMVISQFGFENAFELGSQVSLDPSRIAAQVVSGIGFIGAGTIILQKHVVRGLTTAAGLWVTSAIGLTAGAGMHWLAVAATVLVLVGLEALNFFLHRFGTRSVNIIFSSEKKGAIKSIYERLRAAGVDVENYQMREQQEGNKSVYRVSMELKMQRNKYDDTLTGLLDDIEGVNVENIE